MNYEIEAFLITSAKEFDLLGEHNVYHWTPLAEATYTEFKEAHSIAKNIKFQNERKGRSIDYRIKYGTKVWSVD